MHSLSLVLVSVEQIFLLPLMVELRLRLWQLDCLFKRFLDLPTDLVDRTGVFLDKPLLLLRTMLDHIHPEKRLIHQHLRILVFQELSINVEHLLGDLELLKVARLGGGNFFLERLVSFLRKWDLRDTVSEKLLNDQALFGLHVFAVLLQDVVERKYLFELTLVELLDLLGDLVGLFRIVRAGEPGLDHWTKELRQDCAEIFHGNLLLDKRLGLIWVNLVLWLAVAEEKLVGLVERVDAVDRVALFLLLKGVYVS